MKRVALNTAIVLSTLAAMLVLWQFRGAILIFLLSLATAAAVRPLIERLIARGLPRPLALATTYLVLLLTSAALVLLLAGPLATELQRIGDDFIHAYDRITQVWPEGTKTQRAIARRLPPPQDVLDSIIGSSEAGGLQIVLGATFGAFGLLVNLVVVFVLSIYWSIDRVHFERLWLSLLRIDIRAEARDIWRAVETEVGAYLRSEVLQSLVAGCLLGGVYWLMGLPYPAVLGLIGALAWFVPWVGMLVSVAAIGLLSLPTLVFRPELPAALLFASAAAYTLLVLMLLELLIEPRLFNRRRYNSLLIVVVVVGLAEIVGVLGIVLGPPLAAALQILLSHALRRRATAQVAAGPGPDESLRVRLLNVQQQLADLPQPPPQLVNLSERLAKLVDEAEHLKPASASSSATEVAEETPSATSH